MPMLTPLRPDILPQTTRFVEVDGTALAVGITEEDHGWLATHTASGCWGYGPTVEDALADCGRMLREDKRWYLEGEGSRMVLYGAAYDRRERIWKVFR